ncbi:hypothetical protein MRX96_050205 [Rhipicephalus microplus]
MAAGLTNRATGALWLGLGGGQMVSYEENINHDRLGRTRFSLAHHSLINTKQQTMSYRFGSSKPMSLDRAEKCRMGGAVGGIGAQHGPYGPTRGRPADGGSDATVTEPKCFRAAI